MFFSTWTDQNALEASSTASVGLHLLRHDSPTPAPPHLAARVPARGNKLPAPSLALAAALPSDARWLERLPEKKKPLYTHSLPCIEAWLRSLGFTQSREDPPAWVAEKPLWHARLSLDVTDLHIRYKPHSPSLPVTDIVAVTS
jgi:hypothetical protein